MEQEIKLPIFTKAQRNYVIICYANGEADNKVIEYFRRMFPDYGKEVNLNVLENSLDARIKDIKQTYAEVIKANKNKYSHIPISYSDVRIRCLQQLYDDVQNWIETEEDTSKLPQGLCAQIQKEIKEERRLLENMPGHTSEWLGTIQIS